MQIRLYFQLGSEFVFNATITNQNGHLADPHFALRHNDLQLLAPSVFAVINRLFKFWIGPKSIGKEHF